MVLSLVVGVVLYMVAKKYVFGEDGGSNSAVEAEKRAKSHMVSQFRSRLLTLLPQ